MIAMSIANSHFREFFCDQNEGDMAFARTEREWAERTARHLKAELKRANLTYERLAEMLKEHGFTETKASVTNKLARATMSAHFFLASLAAIGCSHVRLEDV
jgi:hypothetical protein